MTAVGGKGSSIPSLWFNMLDVLSHEAGPEDLTATSPSLADLPARDDAAAEGVAD